MKHLIALSLLLLSGASFAYGGNTYAAEKIIFLLGSKEVKAKLGILSVESVQALGSDETQTHFSYRITSAHGMCILNAVVSLDNEAEPTFKIVEVSDLMCASPGKRLGK